MSSVVSIPQADRLEIITFGVGHGDCFLVEFYQNENISFRLLYDFGVSLSDALLTHLKQSKRTAGKVDLDVVVLSHVDNDHRGGLDALLADNDIIIGELWLPCLPAYQRLSWLFPSRVQTAIKLTMQSESAARNRAIPVIYPLENHVFRPEGNNALSVTVISPARKLMKKLYSASASALLPLLAHNPLPLEWLIRGEALDEEQDERATGAIFDGRSALTPDEFSEPHIPFVPDATFTATLNAYKDTLDQPEFFGNPILNDTSLVLVIDAILDNHHRRRAVLTGDQENWSWISAQHPMGLNADVMKAPHHGGRVYLADKTDHISDVEQFWLWTRPRIALVSANGHHKLPNLRFREALRAAGTTLLCPNKRGQEWIFSDSETEQPKSCFEYYQCDKNQHATITLTLTAKTEFASAAACLSGSGHRGASPVVVMQQRLIEPDESFVRWTQSEVRRQAEWLNEKAKIHRAEQQAAFEGVLSVKFPFHATRVEEMIRRAEKEKKDTNRSALLYEPSPVLRYATVHNLLWTENPRYFSKESPFCAPLDHKEYKALIGKIRTFDHLLFIMPQVDSRTYQLKNSVDLLSLANRHTFNVICAGWAGLPVDAYCEHVESRVLHDLVKHYSARAISCSGYNSDITHYGAVLLHLYASKPEIPDFLAADWCEPNRHYDCILNHKQLDLLLNNNTQSVLPPLVHFKSSDQYSFMIETKNIERFIYEESDGEDETVFSFDLREPNPYWQPLW